MNPTVFELMAAWHDMYAGALTGQAQFNEAQRAEREKHLRWAKMLRAEAHKTDIINVESAA